MSDSFESAHSAAVTIKPVVEPGSNTAVCGTRVSHGSREGSDPCVVCTKLVETGAELWDEVAADSHDDHGPALFGPTVGTDSGPLAPVLHIRCPVCRAVNDVPGLPTICYRCRTGLLLGETWLEHAPKRPRYPTASGIAVVDDKEECDSGN